MPVVSKAVEGLLEELKTRDEGEELSEFLERHLENRWELIEFLNNTNNSDVKYILDQNVVALILGNVEELLQDEQMLGDKVITAGVTEPPPKLIRVEGSLYELAELTQRSAAMEDALAKIRVLWRQPDTMSLWGIPYEMRPGQSPKDLHDAGNTKGWVWLGSPGWWGSMCEETQAKVKAFLAEVEEFIPGGPAEWDVIKRSAPAVKEGQTMSIKRTQKDKLPEYIRVQGAIYKIAFDPDTARDEIIEAAREVLEVLDDPEWSPDGPELSKVLHASNDLAESAINLDEWLSRGGFLPRRWQRKEASVEKLGSEKTEFSADLVALQHAFNQLRKEGLSEDEIVSVVRDLRDSADSLLKKFS